MSYKIFQVFGNYGVSVDEKLMKEKDDEIIILE